MRGDAAADSSGCGCLRNHLLHTAWVEGLSFGLTEEQPHLWLVLPEVGPQCVEQSERQHDVALFAAFTGADPNFHPCAVDVDGPELEGFLQAQAAGVKGHEDRAILQAHLSL